jgi:hypothetical protein
VCGSCSDHFVILPSTTTEVRICDGCDIELREASAASEKMDVTAQITSSLKLALKEKTIETEVFNSFFQHISDEHVSSQSNEEKVSRIKLAVVHLCEWLQGVTNQYNDLKMSSVKLEKEIRAVAQRCIRAEELTREGLAITRQIEEYSSRIGAQSRLIDQLTERIDRLSDSSRSSSTLTRSPPPRRFEMTELRPIQEEERATFCDVMKSLISISPAND